MPLAINDAKPCPEFGSTTSRPHVLALIESRLPDDGERRYALRSVLLETFCETLANLSAGGQLNCEAPDRMDS